MAKVLSERQREILLDMLKTVHWFCDENGIRYFLAFESLLGAVRRNGLVSWQSHLNIVMPRLDYDRFVATFRTLKEYRLLTNRTADYYFLPYAQLVKDDFFSDEAKLKKTDLFLAVIPLDNLSGTTEIAEKTIERINKKKKRLNRNLMILEHLPSARKKDVNQSYLGKKVNRITESITKECRTFCSNEFSDYIGAVCADRNGWKEILKAEWFKDSIVIPFEDIEARIPCGYDKVLTQLYANYQNMPV